MKKNTLKFKKNAELEDDLLAISESEASYPQTFDTKEEPIDSTTLDQDVPEDFREAVPNELGQKPNLTNWSADPDRSEDLIEERDPFTQQPQLDTQTPPELNQAHSYQLNEQRGSSPDENLADRFEEERRPRREKIAKRSKRKNRLNKNSF